MTVNQVAYLNYKETARKNLAEEAEEQRHNLALEAIQRGQMLETQRRNARDFLISMSNLGVSDYHQSVQEQEQRRSHNLSAIVSLADIYERQRHNKATEAVSQQDLSERVRHNTNTEWLGAFELKEANRSNVAKELETSRSNRAREEETNRANREQERRQAAALNEQIRTNVNRENIDAVSALYRINQNQQQIDNNYQLGLAKLGFDYLKLEVDSAGKVLSNIGRMLTGSMLAGSFGGSTGGEFAPSILQVPMLTASAGNG